MPILASIQQMDYIAGPEIDRVAFVAGTLSLESSPIRTSLCRPPIFVDCR